MKTPKIRFIVATYISARDTNGNRYHVAYITSTITGRWLRLETGGPRNAAGLVHEVAKDFGAFHCTEIDLPKREWKQLRKGVDRYEHTTTAADIAALEEVQS